VNSGFHLFGLKLAKNYQRQDANQDKRNAGRLGDADSEGLKPVEIYWRAEWRDVQW